MISLTLVTGETIWVALRHIVSVRVNPAPRVDNSLVRMSNGDQWAVKETPGQISRWVGDV